MADFALRIDDTLPWHIVRARRQCHTSPACSRHLIIVITNPFWQRDKLADLAIGGYTPSRHLTHQFPDLLVKMLFYRGRYTVHSRNCTEEATQTPIAIEQCESKSCGLGIYLRNL